MPCPSRSGRPQRPKSASALFKMNISAPRSDVLTVRLHVDLLLTHSMAYVHQ